MTNEDQEKLKQIALQAENGINDIVEVTNDTGMPEKVDLSNLPLSTMPQKGYGQIDKSIMPFGGRQYPSYMEFEVRPADVPEIKHWSTIDDNIHPQKLYGYFNTIVEKCVTVIGGNWTDIKECDRLWFIMYIHELTFAEAERPLILNSQCKQRTCGEEFKSKLSKEIIQYSYPAEKYHKYIDTQTGCFDIKTRSFGDIMINIPNLKTGVALMAYMNGQKSGWIEDNAIFLDLASYLVKPGLTPTDAVFESIYLQYKTWDVKKLTFMLDLLKEIKISPSTSFSVTCPKCKSKSDQALDLEGGIRSIFLPISNIADELL